MNFSVVFHLTSNIVSGTMSMGWLVLIRHFLIAKERRKAMILSVKEMTSSVADPEASRQVPWLQFFKAVPFW